jgi:hypothetical protein
MPARPGGFARRNHSRGRARRDLGSGNFNSVTVRGSVKMPARSRSRARSSSRKGSKKAKGTSEFIATDRNATHKPPTLQMDPGSILVPSTNRFQYGNLAYSATGANLYVVIAWTPSNVRSFRMSETTGQISEVYKATSLLDNDPPQSIKPGRLSVSMRNISKATDCNGLVRVLVTPNTFEWSTGTSVVTGPPGAWGNATIMGALNTTFQRDPLVQTFTAQELYASKTFSCPVLDTNEYSQFSNYQTCTNPLNTLTNESPVANNDPLWLILQKGGDRGAMGMVVIQLPCNGPTTEQAFLTYWNSKSVGVVTTMAQLLARPDYEEQKQVWLNTNPSGLGQTSQTYDFCVRSHDICRYPLTSTMSTLHQKQTGSHPSLMRNAVMGVIKANGRPNTVQG